MGIRKQVIGGLAAAAIVLAVMAPAYAQDALVPKLHPSAALEQRRAESEGRKKELERDAKKSKTELEAAQKELVSLAAAITKSEARLSELDRRTAAQEKEQGQIEERLKKDRASIGDLVLALERLNRTPPEAILARPGAPLETAQSAMLLQGILPDIYARAESLKRDLKRLEEIVASLQADRQAAAKTMADLTVRQAEMKTLLAKRQSIYAQTQTGLKEQETALREISKEAASLKDLMARIEERERTVRAAATAKAAKAERGEVTAAAKVTPAAAHLTPLPRAGSAQLPVTGMIRSSFGSVDDMGAQSQGLTIEGRAGALVVAPMGGVVRYSGNFKNYGQIIIVEHQKDYHSLIAGLARIDTVVGQSVSSGEPVGILGKSTRSGKGPSLYYELRHKGQPVNPSRRISGL